MEHDFFTNLPTEIMFDIFMRLPLQSIVSCKYVCKSWRYLIKTPEFVDYQNSRSVPCLAFFQSEGISETYKIIEFVDTQNSGQNQLNMVLNFSFPHRAFIDSSADGLLFLSNIVALDLFICNPITCEYVKLPPPVEGSIISHSNIFGFGVSKLTCEYKVVRLFYEYERTGLLKCDVYSLRRGLWRSVEAKLWYARYMSLDICLNGNLHWLASSYSDNEYQRILCFDLETECFNTFDIPHQDLDYRSMCVLGGLLCLCDNSRDRFEIWLMNKYGDDKSWTKEIVIVLQGPNRLFGCVEPIKVFKDGDILFVYHLNKKLCCYSHKTRTIREIDDAGLGVVFHTQPCIYTPNFHPLKTFTFENNVISF